LAKSRKVISSPDPAHPVHISNECVEVCKGILRDGKGQDDASKRFKLRRPIHESLPSIIAVLIVASLVLCAQPDFRGMSDLELIAAVGVMPAFVAVLLIYWLRGVGHLNK
jgi:hypothetical protein